MILITVILKHQSFLGCDFSGNTKLQRWHCENLKSHTAVTLQDLSLVQALRIQFFWDVTLYYWASSFTILKVHAAILERSHLMKMKAGSSQPAARCHLAEDSNPLFFFLFFFFFIQELRF
jgi:hypothetical protein